MRAAKLGIIYYQIYYSNLSCRVVDLIGFIYPSIQLTSSEIYSIGF